MLDEHSENRVETTSKLIHSEFDLVHHPRHSFEGISPYLQRDSFHEPLPRPLTFPSIQSIHPVSNFFEQPRRPYKPQLTVAFVENMPADTSTCQDIFIGNVPLTVLHSDIERLFEDISPPVHIRINKRFAFVGLKDKAAAELAVSKLHGAPFMGETLRVELGKSATRLDRRTPPRDRRGPVRPYERDSGRDRHRPYPVHESNREPSRIPYGDVGSSSVQYPYYSNSYVPGCSPASQGPYDNAYTRLPARPEQEYIPLASAPYYDITAMAPADRYGFRETPKRSSGYSTQPAQYRRR